MSLLDLIAGTCLLVIGLLFVAALGLSKLLDSYDENLWKDDENE